MRLVALLGFLCLTLPALTACGSDEEGGDSGSVSVTGAFGEEATVTYDGTVQRSTTESEVLIEGDGAEVAEGDIVFVEFYIGNGFDGEKAVTTFPEEEDEAPETPAPDDKDKKKGKKSDEEEAEPEEPVDQPPFMLALADGQPFPGVREALDGVTVGSRVEVLATPGDAFGDSGNPSIGIGNKDTVVFVVDVMRKAPAEPTGKTKQIPEGLPSIEESDGQVTGLDFTGVGEPAKTLEVHTVVEGEGPAIKKSGSRVALHYLGAVWEGTEPFDENYSAPLPFIPDSQTGQLGPFTIPGQLIKGWNEGLVGVTEGSRVMLVVPPKWGYGKEGSGENIPGNSTLVFVVDVLAVE